MVHAHVCFFTLKQYQAGTTTVSIDQIGSVPTDLFTSRSLVYRHPRNSIKVKLILSRNNLIMILLAHINKTVVESLEKLSNKRK